MEYYTLCIKKMRKERRLSQRELARKIGISHNYLSEIERNEYDITVSMLIRIANALDVDPRDLIE